MMNTLGVRSAIGSTSRRKLSFRNVSNVVVQLLHTIKYSVPVPFSHITQPNSQYLATSQNSSSLGINEAFTRKVSHWKLSGIRVIRDEPDPLKLFFFRSRIKPQRSSSGHLRSATPASTTSRPIGLINFCRKRLRRAAWTMKRPPM